MPVSFDNNFAFSNYLKEEATMKMLATSNCSFTNSYYLPFYNIFVIPSYLRHETTLKIIIFSNLPSPALITNYLDYRVFNKIGFIVPKNLLRSPFFFFFFCLLLFLNVLLSPFINKPDF